MRNLIFCLCLLLGNLSLQAQTQRQMENALLDLPEMAQLGVMLVAPPEEGAPYYTFKGVEPHEGHLTTIYWFHVYPDPAFQIKVYDVATDQEMSLTEWRKGLNPQAKPEEEDLLDSIKPAKRCLFQEYESKALHYTARVDQGDVFLHFDREGISQSPYLSQLTKRQRLETDYKVLGLSAPCIGIFEGDIGQDTNPILCMLLENGQVEILSLFTALHTNDSFGLLSSGCLPGMTGIEKFEANGGGPYLEGDEVICSYVTIYGIDQTGKRHEVEVFTDDASMIMTAGQQVAYELTLTNDWKFRITEIRDGKRKMPLQGRFQLKSHSDDYQSYEIAYEALNWKLLSRQNTAITDEFPQEGEFQLNILDGNHWEITPKGKTALHFQRP